MRVISGEAGGVPLKAVPGTGTRPTSDKVKESIFNIIGPYFSGGVAADLFAGSGGLGIEALSRGCDRAYFSDKSRKAMETVKSNLEKCRFTEQAVLFKTDAGQAIKLIKESGDRMDLLFLDPPYKNKSAYDLMDAAAGDGIMAEGAIVVCEHDRDTELPDETEQFFRFRFAEYGGTAVSFYSLKREEGDPDE